MGKDKVILRRYEDDQLKDLENIDTTIASFIVDLTTIYILWIVVSSTRKNQDMVFVPLPS